jgi:hypothetical protein
MLEFDAVRSWIKSICKKESCKGNIFVTAVLEHSVEPLLRKTIFFDMRKTFLKFGSS